MEALINYFFSPLDKQYFCTFFLVLTIFGFVFVLGALFMLIYGLYKNMGTVTFGKHVTILVFYSLFYLQSRLLYSMCIGSIQ